MLFLLSFRAVRRLGGVRVALLILLCAIGALAVAGLVLAAPAAQSEPPIPPAPDPLPSLPPLPQPLLSVPECAAVTEIPPLECDTLVYLFKEMNGANWLNKTGWLVTNTPCQWFGITCGLFEGQLRVTGLQLFFAVPDTGPGFPGNNLTGPIPPQIGHLDGLRILNLNYNRLSGFLPEQIGYLDQLEQLQLVNTGLTGPLPGQIGYLTSLRVLSIYGNRFTGDIPTHFGYLTALTTLVIGNTDLTGSLPPEIGLLSGLTQLRIFESPLITGSIPEEYANLKQLWFIDFDGANLTGSFPTWVGDLPSLTHLRLAGNQFTGNYPPTLRDRELVDLYLSPTDVERQIPLWIHEFEGLQVLRLHATSTQQFDGPFPSYLGEMDQLTQLSVIGNRLEGEVPESIWISPNLIVFRIVDSHLELTLPNSVTMAQLRDLTLIGANFTGTLAPLGEVTTLRGITIRDSGFNGDLGWLMNLNELRFAYLDNNQISGPLPTGWVGMSTLVNFTADRNQLSGTIPPDIAVAPALEVLNLDFNALDTTEAAVISLLNQSNPEWRATQTLPPTSITIEPLATGVKLSWEPQGHVARPGFYRVIPTAVDAFHPDCLNPDPIETSVLDGKPLTKFTVTNLCPDTVYEFKVQTITLPNPENKNRLESVETSPATGHTAITSLVLVAASLDHPTMTQKFDSLMDTLQTAVAANPGQLYVVLTDQKDADNTAIYVLAGDEPLKIDGLPNPVTGQLDTTLTEYDMSNSGVLTEGTAGNHLGAFIRWAIAEYAPDDGNDDTPAIPVSFSFIGHGIPLAPAAANLYCYFLKPAPVECGATGGLRAWTQDGPWLSTLPSKQDINPDWTDATAKSLISPYTLAQALEMGTSSGARPLTILDIVHCFAGTVEEFYEVSRSPTTGLPMAHVIIGSPNYTYFGPELALEALLAVDLSQDAATTAANITAAYNRVLNSADLFDGDSGADDIVNGTDDVEHPRVITAVDNRQSQLQAIKDTIDVLSELLYQKLSLDDATYDMTSGKIGGANAAAGHYDTTFCEPQDWRMDAQDGVADLYLLMTALDAEFAAAPGADPEIAAAARAVADAVDAAVIDDALRLVDGTPWYADPPSLWSFSEDTRGLAIFADFLGRPDGGELNRLLGWQAYWYTALPFGASLPHHSNPHPLAFNARPSDASHTWADVVRAFWQRYDGEVTAQACKAPLPELRPRQIHVPLSVSPYESDFGAR